MGDMDVDAAAGQTVTTEGTPVLASVTSHCSSIGSLELPILGSDWAVLGMFREG